MKFIVSTYPSQLCSCCRVIENFDLKTYRLLRTLKVQMNDSFVSANYLKCHRNVANN